MPYTVITDENDVQQAFEELQKDFQADAEENGRLSYKRPIYQHRRKDNLWGAFGPDQGRYYIGFGRGDSTIPVFMVNPPKKVMAADKARVCSFEMEEVTSISLILEMLRFPEKTNYENLKTSAFS